MAIQYISSDNPEGPNSNIFTRWNTGYVGPGYYNVQQAFDSEQNEIYYLTPAAPPAPPAAPPPAPGGGSAAPTSGSSGSSGGSAPAAAAPSATATVAAPAAAAVAAVADSAGGPSVRKIRPDDFYRPNPGYFDAEGQYFQGEGNIFDQLAFERAVMDAAREAGVIGDVWQTPGSWIDGSLVGQDWQSGYLSREQFGQYDPFQYLGFDDNMIDALWQYAMENPDQVQGVVQNANTPGYGQIESTPLFQVDPVAALGSSGEYVGQLLMDAMNAGYQLPAMPPEQMKALNDLIVYGGHYAREQNEDNTLSRVFQTITPIILAVGGGAVLGGAIAPAATATGTAAPTATAGGSIGATSGSSLFGGVTQGLFKNMMMNATNPDGFDGLTAAAGGALNAGVSGASPNVLRDLGAMGGQALGQKYGGDLGGIAGGMLGGMGANALGGSGNFTGSFSEADVQPYEGAMSTPTTGGILKTSGDFGGRSLSMAADTSPLALDGNFDLDAELDDLLDYTGSDAPTDVDMAEMRAAGVDLPVAPKAPAQPEAAPEQQGVTEKEVQQYAKIAKNVYDVYKNLTGKDLPQDFPQQDEGQTDEEYATEVEAYVEDIVGVDIDTNGLAPGSAEFYARVSDATDAIIAQILGEDAEFLQDATVEELQEALKGRREAELEQLARALAVRGQISTLSGVSERVNPFTGQTEEIGFNGMLQSADKAAAQKGFERESEALSGMRGAEARTYLDELLGRNADIYGLRAGRNARILAERLNPEGDMDWRRRAGGRGFDIYDPMLQQLSPRDLEMLLSGIDENEQGAAIERLFGW